MSRNCYVNITAYPTSPNVTTDTMILTKRNTALYQTVIFTTSFLGSLILRPWADPGSEVMGEIERRQIKTKLIHLMNQSRHLQ